MSNNHFGKVNFSTIITPDEECTWFYSYQELQDELNEVCKNHILKKVYTGLQGYLESFLHRENYYDFSYLGGSVILLFDNIAIELCVHGMGMIQYRQINLLDIKIKKTKDFPPDNMGLKGNNYFYDLSEQFQLTYESKKVINITVDQVNEYPFSLQGFDEEKAQLAEKTNSLPNAIHLHLENGVDFGIYADDIEYFYIELKD
ncbi:MAG: hypothetical protein IJN07_03630 [Clostridia bacterium]|nr:hypothetical protein [Clostridia bacterium]MBQ6706584.1 hypothetical protein [Clostridia bacterium]